MNIFKNLKNNTKAFTLVETLLYIGMSAVILTVSLSMLYSLIQYRAKDKIRRDVDGEVLRILDYMSQSIRSAHSIALLDENGDPSGGTTGVGLEINTLNIATGSEESITITLDTAEGNLKLTKLSDVSNLNSSMVTISDLNFRYLTDGVSTTTDIVEVDFVASYALSATTFFAYQREVTSSVKLR